MTVVEMYEKMFAKVRDIGLPKAYEDAAVSFFMGIANTVTPPKTGDTIKDELDAYPDDVISPSFKETITGLVKPTDVYRLHVVRFTGISITYLILLNSDLVGRTELKDDVPATVMMQFHPVEEPSENDTELGALIVFGDKSPHVTDHTRGAILKHELLHVVQTYVTEIANPNFYKELREEIVAEDPERGKDFDDTLDLFQEFLCDFEQYDTPIVNRYTRKPTIKFRDEEEIMLKPEIIEAYEPILIGVESYYNKLEPVDHKGPKIQDPDDVDTMDDTPF